MELIAKEVVWHNEVVGVQATTGLAANTQVKVMVGDDTWLHTKVPEGRLWDLYVQVVIVEKMAT